MTAYSSIRPARSDDAAALVALRCSVYPYLVRGEETTRRMILSPPPGEDRIFRVAERDGETVGCVSAFRDPRSADAGFGRIALHVHPSHRGRGIGTALLAEAAAHLRSAGVRQASVWALPESVEFARARGFDVSRELRFSALDLAGFDAGPAAGFEAGPAAGFDAGPAAGFDAGPAAGFGAGPAAGTDGIRLLPLREVDGQALYEADVAAATDEPGDVPSQPTPYPTWRYEIWEEPGLDRDASTVALADGVIVSFSLLLRDGDRAWSDMTATVPEHRGRGLARLVKTATLRRAAASGIRVAYTSNDESNAPMLAVNARLGYRQIATQFSCLTTLTD
ncbi:GNAT family N-acetyltransferase [Actinoplanes italicus]|uniref:GNAT family N-acetyltransferase n=1 Tax=Actinoplanes italicus TaxID=113567 RepID=UPI001EF33AFB|nr:GNAT family N-acetyltransferase [Actinoplanes italicus]